jgi:PAS domain S-box-containing protein
MASPALSPEQAAPPFAVIRDALAQARSALGMDVAFFTEILEDALVVRAVDGDGAAFGLRELGQVPLAETYCARMVAGELACRVPDVAQDAVAATIGPADGSSPAIGSYIGVPVRHADGRLYGTFCCASRDARPELDDRDVRLLAALAGVVAGQLEHEHQYHQVLETAREPVLITDLAGSTVFANQPLADLLAVGREALAGVSALDFVAEGDRRRVLASLATRADGVLERYEVELVRSDGARVPVEVSGAPLTGSAGEVIGSVAMITDLTERKAAERLSETRFRWLAELVGHQVWISDGEGRLDFVNERVREYYEEGARFERTADWRAHVHPDDLPAVAAARERQAEGLAYEFTARLRRRDGEYREHSAHGFPVHDAEGRVARWYGITTDLTERRAQERLAESEARLRETQKIARLAAFEWSEAGTLVASDEFLELFELPREEFAGWASVLGRAHPDDRMLLAARRELGTSPATFDHRIVLPGGEVRVLQVRRGGSSGTVQDVTEQRLAEAAEHARVEAERANRAKSEFLSRMSHELRTPLNAILGFGQLLELEALTEDQRDSVGHILKAGAHLLQLINEVLEISRIEAGALRLSLEPVGLVGALQEVADLVSPLAAERAIALAIDPGPDPAVHVRADLQRVKQIMLNLLSNAIKYNRHGGLVTVRLRPLPDGRTRVAVSDTGQGLHPEELARLFSPFERLGAAASGTEGTGLGLALSRSLAEAMGGELTATSQVGLGCDLSLVLDTAQAPAPADAPVEELAPAEQPREARTRVLCVEDNPSNLRLVERVLSRAGVEVIAAPQGRLGLELAARHVPDLVLLDLDLPDIPGETVLEGLAASPATAEIPVVICSADASRSTIDRLLAAGAPEYLTKPLDVANLLKTVRSLSDRRGQ